MTEPIQEPMERLVLRSVDDLGSLYPWFETIAERVGLVSSVAFRIHVVLEEAVTNAVMHGQNQGDTGPVILNINATVDRVVAILCDTGRPFDPLQEAPSQPEATPIEDAAIGGLGVTLIQTFCSDLSYRRAGATNELTMGFDIRAMASAGGDK
jgi:serine/threonine-protein kinase RsbW